ncbi:TPA: hypothetical protein ACGR4R_003045 [Aeromonas veronii]|jgi:hypothetical protein|uniref:hypothetical protein n=1 Tax=Aeromonas TaxID=642 RepID=UPI000D3B8592|nr:MULTISPECIES: hypothetical protein [Aeromonas]MBS4705152.1 hypothetical protein [Aeromonas veronii]MCF5728884.1 hypothetical protein [Aeromonas veronii]MDM5056607.1 hypothetical protein [Aeromonas dhakensis]MDM5082764.1 hypothetical protein [Aeromonas dhakensis]QWL60625.1 hypothetical protein HQ400_21375 [Aeromonas jandaei]
MKKEVTLVVDVGLKEASRALGRFSDAAERIEQAERLPDSKARTLTLGELIVIALNGRKE